MARPSPLADAPKLEERRRSAPRKPPSQGYGAPEASEHSYIVVVAAAKPCACRGASTRFAPRTVVQSNMASTERSHESHLIEILCTLQDRGVDFVVAGGVAAVLHGVERMTLDLDVAVSLDPHNTEMLFVRSRSAAIGSTGTNSSRYYFGCRAGRGAYSRKKCARFHVLESTRALSADRYVFNPGE